MGGASIHQYITYVLITYNIRMHWKNKQSNRSDIMMRVRSYWSWATYDFIGNVVNEFLDLDGRASQLWTCKSSLCQPAKFRRVLIRIDAARFVVTTKATKRVETPLFIKQIIVKPTIKKKAHIGIILFTHIHTYMLLLSLILYGYRAYRDT